MYIASQHTILLYNCPIQYFKSVLRNYRLAVYTYVATDNSDIQKLLYRYVYTYQLYVFNVRFNK